LSLSIGIIGLPNAGKSTLFNALLGRQIAEVAERPFTTIEPNAGVVSVPDRRLDQLVALIKPERVVPATVKFIDIAGLVKGAHQGEGLGNKFLGEIRSCQAILHLVRAFENRAVSRVEGSLNPASDVAIVNLEMVMADFEVVVKRTDEVKKKARTRSDLGKLLKVLEKLKAVLGEGKLASEADFSEEEKLLVKDLNLLTLKPVIYVLNTDEAGLKGEGIRICARLELALLDLKKEEKEEYLKEVGVKELGLDRLIREAYFLLDLITFYTVKGGKEVHAWPLKRGETALEAARWVHTDMAGGFIKAEVIKAEVLLSLGGWQEAKEAGKVRLEGRDYKVTDGEVLEFKFGHSR
jgi:small GTP-binding protein